MFALIYSLNFRNISSKVLINNKRYRLTNINNSQINIQNETRSITTEPILHDHNINISP